MKDVRYYYYNTKPFDFKFFRSLKSMKKFAEKQKNGQYYISFNNPAITSRYTREQVLEL